jgi:hypothetical protein
MAALADVGDRVTGRLLVSPAVVWALGEVQPASSKAASTVAMNTLLWCPNEQPAAQRAAARGGRFGLDLVDPS